jgi:hypothetical protein
MTRISAQRDGSRAERSFIVPPPDALPVRGKSLAEFGGAIFSDECNPVVSWCALIHHGITFG